MNPLITTISMLAVVVSVTGNIPQLVTMLRKRSSSGQSILGWGLGFTANFALVFVNGIGYHAPLLAAGNVLSATACVTAMCLVRLYRGKPAVPAATAPEAPAVDADRPAEASVASAPVPVAPPPAFAHAVTDMRTQEFVLLRDLVVAEHHRRTGERQLAVA